MFWDLDITLEDEEEMITKIAERIHNHGMDGPAILFIESIKPLAYLGAQMGLYFVSPFLRLSGENFGIKGETFLRVFEKRENVEKLLKHLEKLANQEKL